MLNKWRIHRPYTSDKHIWNRIMVNAVVIIRFYEKYWVSGAAILKYITADNYV